MANIKSAKKRILIARRNRKRNLLQKEKVKGLLKQLRKWNMQENQESNQEQLQKHLSAIHSQLDRTSAQVIPPNKASRLKSQAAKKVKSLLGKG